MAAEDHQSGDCEKWNRTPRKDKARAKKVLCEAKEARMSIVIQRDRAEVLPSQQFTARARAGQGSKEERD